MKFGDTKIGMPVMWDDEDFHSLEGTNFGYIIGIEQALSFDDVYLLVDDANGSVATVRLQNIRPAKGEI